MQMAYGYFSELQLLLNQNNKAKKWLDERTLYIRRDIWNAAT
jgi:hypothetical protein